MIDSNVSVEEKWGLISLKIQEFVTAQQYKTWFKSMRLDACDEGTFSFTVPNGFLKSWISNYYQDVLIKAVESVAGGPVKTIINIDQNGPKQKPIKTRNPDLPAKDSSEAAPAAKAPEGNSVVRKVNDFYLNPNYRFDTFIVGPCNQLSYAASMAVSDNPAQAYNPFFLHGKSGLGKTHLLQAICQKMILRKENTKIAFLSCETFINNFISSVEKGNLNHFRNKYRHVDILLIDDVHLLARKERTQEEFFHTFNSLYNSGKQIVLSSDAPPSAIPTMEERLVSRFKWGLVTEMDPPDLETRCAILKMKSRLKDVNVPDEVIAFLAENINTNIRELEGAITKVVGYAMLMEQKLDLDMAQEAMKDVIKRAARFVSIDRIVKIITEHFNLKLSDLQSKKRTQSITLPRQISMFLIKKLTPHSLQEIGAYFGGRDHTTVLHASTKIKAKLADDKKFKELLDDLTLDITRI